MRLLALALVVHLALIGRARADAPALQLEGELPFTEAELREALEPRLPDAQVPASSTVVVRGDGPQVVLELGARGAALALGQARGPDAARIVVLALLDLMLAEPPPRARATVRREPAAEVRPA